MSGFDPLGNLTVSGGKWFITDSHSEHRGYVASHYFAAALECKGVEQKSIEEAFTPLFGSTSLDAENNKATHGKEMISVYTDMHKLFYMILATVQAADYTTQFSSEMWAPTLFDNIARRGSWVKNKMKGVVRKKHKIPSPEAYWERMKAADMLMLKPLKDIRSKVDRLGGKKLPTWQQYQDNANISRAINYKQRAIVCSDLMTDLEKIIFVAKNQNVSYFETLQANQRNAATIYGLTPYDKAYIKLVGKVVKATSEMDTNMDAEAMLEEEDTVFGALLTYYAASQDKQRKAELVQANKDIEEFLNKRRHD